MYLCSSALLSPRRKLAEASRDGDVHLFVCLFVCLSHQTRAAAGGACWLRGLRVSQMFIPRE